MLNPIWKGCAICYFSGLSWFITDGIGLGWQALIALVVYAVGEAVAKKGTA